MNSIKKNNSTHCSSSLAFKENEPTAVIASKKKKKLKVNINVQTGATSLTHHVP